MEVSVTSRLGQAGFALPAQPTRLIGREAMLSHARARLLSPDVRLLTLTGTGGTGKTRLAIALAASVLEHFVDGVWFVDLSPVTDPGLVMRAVARVLEIETSDAPVVTRLEERLHTGQQLLVLDNFEQVLAASTDLSKLLSTCRGLKLLVTSRAPLEIAWEHIFPVLPLGLPEPAGACDLTCLKRCPSVALFVDNAPAVAQICIRLDGLPLAIELAAARSRFLPPVTLLARLESRLGLLRNGRRDSPARHHTLSAAIDWSYDLLPPEERALFRRLGVFVGGCELEAAEAVAPEMDV